MFYLAGPLTVLLAVPLVVHLLGRFTFQDTLHVTFIINIDTDSLCDTVAIEANVTRDALSTLDRFLGILDTFLILFILHGTSYNV